MSTQTPFDPDPKVSCSDGFPWSAMVIIAIAVLVVGWVVMMTADTRAAVPSSEGRAYMADRPEQGQPETR
jgi:hypothetical protein